jgi:hypothetical protein
MGARLLTYGAFEVQAQDLVLRSIGGDGEAGVTIRGRLR